MMTGRRAAVGGGGLETCGASEHRKKVEQRAAEPAQNPLLLGDVIECFFPRVRFTGRGFCAAFADIPRVGIGIMTNRYMYSKRPQ